MPLGATADMASPANPAETRAFILERLVGDTGEPDLILHAARALAERALPAILQGLGENLGLTLEIEFKAAELARLAEARPAGANHAMTVAASAASPDAMILTMDPQAIALFVTALFGGDPGMGGGAIERELSPTEIEMATLVFEEIARAIDGSGSRAFDIKLPLPPAFSGADLKKHIIRDGPGVRLVYSVMSPAGAGTIALMMPQRVLLKHRGGTGAAASSPDWRARFGEEVMRSTVDLTATMPLARMTLGDLSQIEAGQIIEIESSAQTEARLSARQKTLFVCEFGKLGQNYTVRIRHPYDAGQELIDGLLPG